MPKTGHIPMEEKPIESLEIILDFIKPEKDSITSI
jgi:pimeloyl-ACP methyl ester carboxylesterase